MRNLVLPRCDWTSEKWVTRSPFGLPSTAAALVSRSVFAPTHVVADPVRAAGSAGLDTVNREARPQLRLWAIGVGVAEAMDPAKQGMRTTRVAVERLVDDTLSKMTCTLSLLGLV